MKTIIVPTDFSSSATNAANFAAGLAASIDADLLLLNVISMPISTSEIPIPQPVLEEMVNAANTDLDELIAKLNTRTKNKITISKEIVLGTVEYKIKEKCEEKKPFAVVMGMTQGHKPERYLFGSNSLAVARHIHYPVLIIPEHVAFRGIGMVGIACDLHQVTETFPFDKVKELLDAFSPDLHIIHVSEKDSTTDMGETLSVQNHLSKYKPQFHFLHQKNIATGIDEYAKKLGLDILIIIPKHHGILDILNEKYSKKIIAEAEVPVLSVS
ncbi:MAG: universal stress protein [Bacteroidetes bacterium]|nr:universal stress protein [Bacteroidota bacterium]